MHFARRAWCALMCALVVSCGGGGGDDSNNNDGGSSGNTLSFTLDRSAIAFDFDEEQTGGAETVVATATGEYQGTIYVGVIVEGAAIDPNVQINVGGVQGRFTFTPARGLAPGQYNGRILLLACSDQACNNRIGGTPLTVNYSVRVRAILRATPDAVTLSAVSGNAASTQLTVQLPDGATSHTPIVNRGSAWLSVTAQSATTTRLTARSMPSGAHTGSIEIRAGNRFVNVPVTYTVNAPPGGDRDLGASPSNLTFSAREGALSAPAILTVTAPSWDEGMPTDIEIGYPTLQNWLSVVPVSGGYQIRANASNLRARTLEATLIVSGRAPASTVRIPVSFTIGEGFVTPADVHVLIDSQTTPTSPVLSGSVPINVVEGAAEGWTATSNADWLVLTRNAGQTGTTVDYTIPASQIADLPNFHESVATVTVTPTAPAITPVTFEVRLNKQLAQLMNIGPYFQLSDRGARVVVRGRGFIASRDWSTHLRVGLGTAGAGNVLRVNDTELLVDLPPPPFSSIIFNPTNELGVIVSEYPLRVVQPRTYAYTALTTGYSVRAVEYDAERQGVYLVRSTPGAEALIRYRFGILNSWEQWPMIQIPSMTDATLNMDGAQIWATTSVGTMYVIDPDTGNESSFSIPRGLGPVTTGRNLVFTNDRRLWVGLGQTVAPRTLAYRDGLSGEFTDVTAPFVNFYGGPWFHVSRNGERLVISQADNMTPAPPLLYLDAADGELKVAPFTQETGDTYAMHASMSDDASRMVLNNFRVRDRDFTQIGVINVVQATDDNFLGLHGAAVVSPDGTRAYVIAYEANEFVEPTPQFLPRVYVFDISTPGSPAQRMPLLGYFELNDYPTCLRFDRCDVNPVATISPDGNTLFYAGSERLLIAPIPAEGSLTQPANAGAGSFKPSAPRTVQWDLRVR